MAIFYTKIESPKMSKVSYYLFQKEKEEQKRRAIQQGKREPKVFSYFFCGFGTKGLVNDKMTRQKTPKPVLLS